jgi:hypothetical protein
MVASERALLRALIPLLVTPGAPSPPLAASEWEALLALAAEHGVAALLACTVPLADVPAPARARLWAFAELNRRRNEALKAEQETLLAALAAAGLPALPMKGAELSGKLFGDVGVRQIADLDILVRPEDFDDLDALLAAQGFSRTVRDHAERLRRAQELAYVKRAGESTLALDLHFRLLPYAESDPLTARVWREGWTRENLLVYLCANTVSHRFASLRHLADVHALLRQTGATLAWNAVAAAAQELEFAPGIWQTLAFVEEWAPGIVPAATLSALRPHAWERKLLAWTVGIDAVAALARSRALAGPFGALGILASTRGVAGRLRQAARLVFPPAVYLRQQYAAAPPQPAWPLYASRLAQKLPLALRDLFRTVF